jgi:hypothetical protein
MIAVLVTVVWAAATFTFNSIAGTDYGFLNGKPHTASLLEVPKEQPPEQRTPDTPAESHNRRAPTSHIVGIRPQTPAARRSLTAT